VADENILNQDLRAKNLHVILFFEMRGWRVSVFWSWEKWRPICFLVMSSETERTKLSVKVPGTKQIGDATLVHFEHHLDWFDTVLKHNGTLSHCVPTLHTNWERPWRVRFFAALKHDRSRLRLAVTFRLFWQIWRASDNHVRVLGPTRLISTKQVLLFKIFPTFYGFRRSITVITKDLLLSHLNPIHIITHYSRTTLLSSPYPHLQWSLSFQHLWVTFRRFLRVIYTER
jgi:hypothetical protein